jgi:hypothetical protein
MSLGMTIAKFTFRTHNPLQFFNKRGTRVPTQYFDPISAIIRFAHSEPECADVLMTVTPNTNW